MTAYSADVLKRLHSLLPQLGEHLQALIETLQQEQHSLLQRALDHLPPLTDRKTALLQRLHSLEQQLYSLDLPIQPAAAAVTQKSIDADHLPQPLNAHYQQVKEQLAQVRQLNQGNGLLINRQHQQYQRLLHLLSPQQPTYTKQGLTHSPQTHSRLGTA